MATPSGRKPTIYDLSVLTGASPSTVSAVLNGSWRKRRISEATADMILAAAARHGYSANRQARGLRQARSGLVGLLLPVYDYRYFSSLAQAFEVEARRRGYFPIVVSTHRNPAEERDTTEDLISYSVEGLFICGAGDPDGLHDLCERAGLRHVNLDLPGRKAPSVISDNASGGRTLTEAILDRAEAQGPVDPEDVWFLGGRDDPASRDRLAAFRAVTAARLGAPGVAVVDGVGYSSERARAAFAARLEQPRVRLNQQTRKAAARASSTGAISDRPDEPIRSENAPAGGSRLPRAVFVNSAINFEGLLRVITDRPDLDYSAMVVGCFDYDPFASFLPFPVLMMRQDVSGMIATAFDLFDAPQGPPAVHLVPPQLVEPRTALTGPMDAIDD